MSHEILLDPKRANLRRGTTGSELPNLDEPLLTPVQVAARLQVNPRTTCSHK
jgi:hypothetical protein